MAKAGKHVPLRRCVVCRESFPKAELLRLARDDEGAFRLDPAGRAGGRGTWICASCAGEEHDKRFRQAFRGQAGHVRAMLDATLGRSEARHAQDGGMNER